MEGESLSFAANHEKASKDGSVKKKIKRKFSLVINESFPVVKKRKLSKSPSVSDNFMHEITNHVQYEKTKDYFKVIAKPRETPAPPPIFRVSQFKDNLPNVSDQFLLRFFSLRTFNSDVNARFCQEIISHCNGVDTYDRKEGKKKKREKKDDSNTEKGKEKEREEVKEATGRKAAESERTADEEAVSQVDLYRVIQRKDFIFHMHHPSKFSFHGEIKATIISGEVEILGYTLSENSSKDSVEVYSPNFCTPLIVETKAKGKVNPPQEDLSVRLKRLLSEDDLGTLLAKLKPDDSLLLVKQITSDLGIVLNKYIDKALFPKDLEDVSSVTETMESLQSIFTFKLSKEGKHFRKNPQWDKIPLGHCTVLCGGKGVGKSMVLKYYINKFVSVGERVLVLDFDPGQPEFTFPGSVSAVIVDEPVIGPNFTHVTDPARMTYFGDVNVARNPAKYLECVRYIIDSCKEDEELVKMRWLVNTMGFCKGLGVDLMITILKLLGPNTVVQIKGSDFKNNYPFYLTPGTVNAKAGFRSMAVEDVNLVYDLRVVFSSAEREKKQLQGGLKRKQLRDIMSISYLSKMVSPPFYNFNAVQPYLISFSKVYLGVEFLVNPNDVVKAFNGNTVSLSRFEPDGEEVLSAASAENEYFRIVVKPRVGPCLGLGFVRGVDCAEKKFYLLTPLPAEVLDRANCLSLGRVSPPHCMFLRQEAVESELAYTTTCAVDIIKSVKRMFRLPGSVVDREKTVAKF